MDKWQPSTLSWSFSRKIHFDSCRRHYFYHRFWGQDPSLKWRLFEMRNLTTLAMLRGQVVHTVIARALEAIRLDQTVDIETARQSVTDEIRARYMESQQRLWHVDNRPPDRKQSQITSLLEHYYGFPDTADRAREARRIAWLSLENLIGSEFWASIASSSPSRWVEIEQDGFPCFDLDGIRVYARIDFAHSDDAPTIVDWKTGSPGPDDRKQLALYCLYAQARWGWQPLETRLQAVYLQPELCVETFTPTAADIESIKDEVRTSFAQMLELEPAFGPADIANFPPTEDTSQCAWCRFQGACGAARAAEEEPA